MCHAVGQQHEQSRSDRDDYIKLFWNNIKNGQGNNNMIKEQTHDYNPYDQGSILQYDLHVSIVNLYNDA